MTVPLHLLAADATFFPCRTEVDLVSDLNDINEYTEDFNQREEAQPQTKMGKFMEKVW